ncbi:MAG: hypothetical protein JSV03_14785 [Planctomycetota bacterium]|nr:MAG: hypothetical protein JSV03_14785 [Planctomycetota bacterium]
MKKLATPAIVIVIIALLLLNLAVGIGITPPTKPQIDIPSPFVGISAVNPDIRANVIIVFRARANGTLEALRIDESRINRMPSHEWVPLTIKETQPQPPAKPAQN